MAKTQKIRPRFKITGIILQTNENNDLNKCGLYEKLNLESCCCFVECLVYIVSFKGHRSYT